VTTEAHIDWFDELDLDPHGHPVSMGTHALGTRPWLVSDDREDAELALKADLLRTERDSVFGTSQRSEQSALELADLVGATIDLHPLEAAALTVQEDLCLLERRPEGWFLDSGSVCFPTRWRLSDKLDRHIAAVHGPVDGYDPRIIDRVDRLFDQLTARPVWRRNWFLMSDPTLFQPEPPPEERVILAADAATDLFIRSERQTLRRLPSGWIVFTIRIQQDRLADLVTTPERANTLGNWVEHVSRRDGRRRHLTDAQRVELVEALSSGLVAP
jgi:hypothetical protein